MYNFKRITIYTFVFYRWRDEPLLVWHIIWRNGIIYFRKSNSDWFNENNNCFSKFESSQCTMFWRNIDKKEIDVVLCKYDNSELVIKWINLRSVNKKIFSCFYELSPDEMVLAYLQQRSLNDLANIIIEYPNTWIANVLCFDDQVINKLPPLSILHIHTLVKSHHRNKLLM